MEKIKTHNPAYTLVATAGTWDKLERSAKAKQKPFEVEVAPNTTNWFYDISQTIGKPPPTIYQNVSGKVDNYQQILDCLKNNSTLSVVFEDGENYYSGIGQDSYLQDNTIFIRPSLSEQQIIFALVREIIKSNQNEMLVTEAASYIICQHLGMDTANFTFGYLFEQLGAEETLKSIKNSTTQDSIAKEVEVLAGHLNASLPFLQSKTENTNADTQPQAHTTHPHSGISPKMLELLSKFSKTVPDKAISLESIKKFGYYNINMHPIRHSMAVKFYSQGYEVYRLYEDNSETRIDSADEFEKTNGPFGIDVDTWELIQRKMFDVAIGNAIVKINSGDAAKAVKGSNKNESTPETPEVNKEPAHEISNSGGVVFAEDDLDYNAIANETWLDKALPIFVAQAAHGVKGIPYFQNCANITITPAMEKINALVLAHCVKCISWAINHYRTKDTKTGKYSYQIDESAPVIFNTFSFTHIIVTLDTLRDKITAPSSIKFNFEGMIKKLHKHRKTDKQRSTLEDDTARMKAKQNKSDIAYNERNEEIHSIIETYKECKTPEQHKKKPDKMPTM